MPELNQDVTHKAPAPLAPILLVEDDENDVYLTRRAFTAAGIENPLLVAYSGDQAIELLTNHSLRPCLLITDIKMPKLNGFDLLGWLLTQPRLHDMPKLVISSSVLEEDLAKSLNLGATAYFSKPNAHVALIELVREWKKTYLENPCPA